MRGLNLLFAELTALTMVFTAVASADLTNRYVVKNNAGAAEPYDSWANAAADIQTAVYYAYAGETVLVAAATYDAGGVTNYPAGSFLTNRVAIDKAITVRSANNDPASTIIKGAWDPVTTNGPAAVRCVYMAVGSSLIGFTVTNGATVRTNESPVSHDNLSGGGVWCPNTGPIISNCVIANNSAETHGGGARLAKLYNCMVRGNAAKYGGGVNSCDAYNCLITGNSTFSTAGGAYNSTLYNCTVVSNSNVGVAGSRVAYNSIVYFNQINYNFQSIFTNSCTWPAQDTWVVGDGNITNDPVFVNPTDGNWRLKPDSPCVNSGMNQSWMTNAVDMGGVRRILYGTVDMGAYEVIFEGTVYGVK